MIIRTTNKHGRYGYGLLTFQAAFKLIQVGFIAESTSLLAATFSKGDTSLILYFGSFCV